MPARRFRARRARPMPKCQLSALKSAAVGVSPPSGSPAPAAPARRNFRGTSLVHLDREVRAIQREIARSKYRGRFSVETSWAAQPLDLLQELRVLKPAIVHFAGHGDGTGLAFEGPDGDTQWVSAQGLGGCIFRRRKVRESSSSKCLPQRAARKAARPGSRLCRSYGRGNPRFRGPKLLRGILWSLGGERTRRGRLATGLCSDQLARAPRKGAAPIVEPCK